MGVKKIVHQLQEGKSIAVTDDTFIKVFLGKSISYEELHTEAKWFSKERSATYNVILDKPTLIFLRRITRMSCSVRNNTHPSKSAEGLKVVPPVLRVVVEIHHLRTRDLLSFPPILVISSLMHTICNLRDGLRSCVFQQMTARRTKRNLLSVETHH